MLITYTCRAYNVLDVYNAFVLCSRMRIFNMYPYPPYPDPKHSPYPNHNPAKIRPKHVLLKGNNGKFSWRINCKL